MYRIMVRMLLRFLFSETSIRFSLYLSFTLIFLTMNFKYSVCEFLKFKFRNFLRMRSSKNKNSNMASLVDFFNNVEKYGLHDMSAQTTNETRYASLSKDTKTKTPKNKIEEKLQTTNKSTKLFKKLSTLNEVLTTEKAYVDDLMIIHTAFYLPLQASLSTNKPLINEQDFNLIYASIPDILKVNSLLLSELNKAAEVSLDLSSVFTKFAPLLKMYQNYVNNFDQATEKNSELISKSSKYSAFVTVTENAPRNIPKSSDIDNKDNKSSKDDESISSVNSISLNERKVGSLLSLLIKPIQRIPRYSLLLGEVIKQCEDEFEKRELRGAFDIVKSIAENINKKMHENESRRQLTLICSKFSVNDVTKILENPARLFIKMGFLKKRTRKGTFNEYVFCLFNDCILYSSETQFGKLTLHRMLRFEDSCIAKNYTEHSNRFTGAGSENELANSGHSLFVISTSLKSFVVEANSNEDKEKWIDTINNAYRKYKHDWTKKISLQESITGKKSTIRMARKEGGAPVWMEDTASNNCLICGTEFGFFNRKHHCRRCGKIVCNDCSNKKAIVEGVYNDNPVRVCSRCYYLIHNANKTPK